MRKMKYEHVVLNNINKLLLFYGFDLDYCNLQFVFVPTYMGTKPLCVRLLFVRLIHSFNPFILFISKGLLHTRNLYFFLNCYKIEIFRFITLCSCLTQKRLYFIYILFGSDSEIQIFRSGIDCKLVKWESYREWEKIQTTPNIKERKRELTQ